DATYYEATEFSSGVFLQGSSWEFLPFDVFGQQSAIQTILAKDFTGDGVVDLLIAGNKFGAEVETARYDSSNGILLVGNGNGEFNGRRFLESGFYTPGNTREMLLMENTAIGQPIVIVASNDGPLAAYVAMLLAQ
ncbi:MAG: hypothetical protein HRT74_04755, partial [Flavobacteriales bacterium]|nr:hypothetical protein [Flavobacteriales bacterium]